MNRRFSSAIAIAFIVSVGLACSLLRPTSPLTWQVVLEIDAATPDKQRTAEHIGSIIQRRLESIGLHNATVEIQRTPGRLLVSLPEVRDRDRVIKLITSQGLLELTAVVSPQNPMPAQTYPTEQEAQLQLREVLQEPGVYCPTRSVRNS